MAIVSNITIAIFLLKPIDRALTSKPEPEAGCEVPPTISVSKLFRSRSREPLRKEILTLD